MAREAADLILLDDNFTTIVETVKDGRRIYDNIRKAVGYIFTIHIPIAFASLLAPILKISPAAILLLPLHVVLLELIIDPTCSIVLERQPAEEDIMDRKPRSPKEKLLSPGLFAKSIIQGFVIFAASFSTYYILLDNNVENAPIARAMGLVIIMLSNLFLVQVNSSNHDFVFQTIGRLMKDKVMWAVNIFTIIGIFAILYTPIAHFLKFEPLSAMQFLGAVVIAGGAVLWYELVKLVRKINRKVGK
ncbi:cation-translocating P-type ATPase [Anaerosporobacter sp.]|uniref:cation-translocating P-type ATPase n=1 Tax=Anaerosporobacter sp. TaxID=1872529 RepID=UPI002F4197C5